MKSTTTLLAAALLAAATMTSAACSKQGEVEQEPAAAADTVEGTVRQVGSTPFVRTVVENDSASARVIGELEGEIARATGADVRVWGAWKEEGGDPGRALEAAGYDLLSVDGTEPRVGFLRFETDRGYYLVTADSSEVALGEAPTGLGEQVGAKVWVVLGEAGGVQRYGVLRKP